MLGIRRMQVTENKNTTDLALAIKQHLESLSDFGVSHVPKSDPESANQLVQTLTGLGEAGEGIAERNTIVDRQPEKGIGSQTGQSSPTSGGKSAINPTALVNESLGSYAPSLDPGDRSAELSVLQGQVAACSLCPELVQNRSQTVFGVGTVTPRLVFLGEGPGADEDRLGEPFVGAAGQLLDKIIAAMKLAREEVYILNTVKCRPPNNRNPSESELGNCWNFAARQLEILQPEIICCLGSVAARTLLKTTQSIGRMRGKFFEYRSSRVVVTYHPAYLLRTPSAKKHVWTDMQMIMTELGLEL